MKNFPIDAVLKALTMLGYISVYVVAGSSAVRLIQTQSTQKPSFDVAPQITVTTATVQTQTIAPSPENTPKIREKLQATPTALQRIDTPIPTSDSRCIIVVDGASYNVTDFRREHSGGDIFTCGTDMSSTFHGQHDTGILRKMDRYKI